MHIEKPELRREMQAKRRALTADAVRDLSARMVAQLLALPELVGVRIVAVYAAMQNEIDPAAAVQALRARGVTIVYPRVARDHLVFHVTSDPAAFAPSRLGVPEPTADLSQVALADVDLFLIPGLAFDRQGQRVGWGKGYYDHTLAAAPHATRVGLAYGFQIVTQVPTRPGDEAMDLVVTDEAVHRHEGAMPRRATAPPLAEQP
jgi:5-formyltetrahydrofolate cyclo-ligase